MEFGFIEFSAWKQSLLRAKWWVQLSLPSRQAIWAASMSEPNPFAVGGSLDVDVGWDTHIPLGGVHGNWILPKWQSSKEWGQSGAEPWEDSPLLCLFRMPCPLIHRVLGPRTIWSVKEPWHPHVLPMDMHVTPLPCQSPCSPDSSVPCSALCLGHHSSVRLVKI